MTKLMIVLDVEGRGRGGIRICRREKDGAWFMDYILDGKQVSEKTQNADVPVSTILNDAWQQLSLGMQAVGVWHD